MTRIGSCQTRHLLHALPNQFRNTNDEKCRCGDEMASVREKTEYVGPWEVFRPGCYEIDASRVAELEFEVSEDNRPARSVPFFDALDLYRADPIKAIESRGPITVRSQSTARSFCGSPFAIDLLEVCLTLQRTVENPVSACRWFYYDWDRVVDDMHDAFYFFIVTPAGIAPETAIFHRYTNSGFDPSFFIQTDSPKAAADDIWSGAAAHRKAQTAFWYRKFYQDTPTGQLVALRDEPELYFYSEGRIPAPSTSLADGSLRLLVQVRNVCIALLLVAVLILLKLM